MGIRLAASLLWWNAAFLLWMSAGDLAALRSEPDPQKRSDKAMQYAARAVDEARETYRAGGIDQAKAALNEVREAVNISYASLEESGKDARRSPKHFKRAELKIRELLRRLRGLSAEADVDDRPAFDAVVSRLQEIHDELLAAIMGTRKGGTK